MSVRITFKPGIKQAQEAARYFHEAMNGLVEAMIDGLEEHSYLIRSSEGPSLRLRTWNTGELAQEQLHELFEWLIALRNDARDLLEEPPDATLLKNKVATWLGVHLGGVDMLAELSIAPEGNEAESLPQFTLGLQRGRSVMISTDTLLFTWLEKDIFGLTLAGHGSYLCELEAGGSSASAMRKAS